MKGILFSLFLTTAILFGFYWAVSHGHLSFPFQKADLIELGMDKEQAKKVFKKKAVDFDALGFFDTIHYYIESGFRGIGAKTGIPYKGIYILLYFLLLPLIWTFSIDRRTDFHWYKIGYLALFTAIYLIIKKKPMAFAETLYDKCENFLKGMDGLGLSYPIASVIFCIFLPIITFSIVSMFCEYLENKKHNNNNYSA